MQILVIISGGLYKASVLFYNYYIRKEMIYMTQKELYDLAGKLSDKDVAYLVCSHLEHIRKAEMNWRVDARDRYFIGHVRVKLKEES